MKRSKNIAENFNSLSRVHERYRRQTDRQTIKGSLQVSIAIGKAFLVDF